MTTSLPARVADCVDELPISTTHLSVPLLGNAIQVGTYLCLPSTTISVSRISTAVEVRRTDGKPLQSQIVDVRSGRPERRTDVFTTPIDALRLRLIRRPDGTRRWVVADAPVCRDCDVVQLVETIISFALAKQHRPTAATRLPA